jgi:hypothetical protein
MKEFFSFIREDLVLCLEDQLHRYEPVASFLAQRAFDENPDDMIRTDPLREYLRLLTGRAQARYNFAACIFLEFVSFREDIKENERDTMEKEDILRKVNEIKDELERDQFQVMMEKIQENEFHLHRSERNIFLRWLIRRFRKRLLVEVQLIMEPVLEKQKEINTRFLYELEKIKKRLSFLERDVSAINHESENSESHHKNQE